MTMKHSSVTGTGSISLRNNKKSDLAYLLCASAALVLLQASDASANPTGADVVSGGISISNPSATKTVIHQSTDKAIINWKDFDILNGETTQFIQPSSGSIALNRIRNGKPTNIDGILTANGKLMVVNPNGVFFGANSHVDVAGLIASTADISDSDFNNGKIHLSVAGNPDASIVNKGSITAAQGGLVALVAPNVRNDGVIQANMGTVALASAQTASIDMYGDNLYSFALDQETTKAAQDSNAAIENNGIVSVGEGKVLLTAKVAKNVVDNVINNTGIIEASSAHMEGGTIVLDGGDGNVKVSGKINASGKTGGNITVTGENISVAGADINASGINGGGTVKIGGDYQGGGTIPHAKTVTVDNSSKIDVSATDSGNGGTAVVWSDELTDFNGSVLGTGGINGGNGGLAEVSSKGELGYNGAADLHATNGESGTLLLDPNSLFIGSFADHFVGTDHFVNFAPIVTTLQGGTNVTSTAINNVSVLEDMVWSGSGSFTINASNYAIIEADIRASFNGSATQGAVTINAGNRVQMGDANIHTARGDININTNRVDMSTSTIRSDLGDVNINNSGRFGSNLADVISGSSVTLHQSTAGSIQNAVDAIDDVKTGDALLQLGNGTWNEAVTIDQANFHLKGNGSANTIIKAPLPTTNSVIKLNDGLSNIFITDLATSGGKYGIYSSHNNGFKLINSLIKGTSIAGLRMDGTSFARVEGNTFYNDRIGILGNDSVSNTIIDNNLTLNVTGMNFTNDTLLRVKHNSFTNSGTGVVYNNVVGSRIDGHNSFNNLVTAISTNGGSSISILDNDITNIDKGIHTKNTEGVSIMRNVITGGVGEQGEPTFGIRVDGGLNTAIVGNKVSNFKRGIKVLDSSESSILSNEVFDISKDAIFLENNVHSLVYNNNIHDSENGVVAIGNEFTDITKNNITNINDTAIFLQNKFYTLVNNNVISNAGAGVDAFGNGGLLNNASLTLDSNEISNSLYGAIIENTDGATLKGNIFVNNGVGASFYTSNNASLTGDIFTGNVLGINLDNSQNTFIDGVTMTPLSSGIGIVIQNGSGGTLVRGLDITGGGIGVLLDGKGSSMQFSGNTSKFTGQDWYFWLQNNAMFGETLDASQQFFEGVRASDFTLAQRDAAEGKTIDVEDGIPTIGNVFYKDFFSFRGLDGLTHFEEFPKLGLFSYSGRTITNNPGETPPQFDVPSLTLSLLSPTGGGGGNIQNPANLNPNQLGGLEPAAGGEASNLASLEPAAGGEPNCGNNFLGSGFNNKFDMTTCSVQQQ